MARELKIETDGEGSTGRVVLAGDVDMAARPAVEAALRTACSTWRMVVVDVSGVTFMDSSGLNAMVAANRFAEEHETELVVTSPTEQVRRLFELAGTTEFIKVVEP